MTSEMEIGVTHEELIMLLERMDAEFEEEVRHFAAQNKYVPMTRELVVEYLKEVLKTPDHVLANINETGRNLKGEDRIKFALRKGGMMDQFAVHHNVKNSAEVANAVTKFIADEEVHSLYQKVMARWFIGDVLSVCTIEVAKEFFSKILSGDFEGSLAEVKNMTPREKKEFAFRDNGMMEQFAHNHGIPSVHQFVNGLKVCIGQPAVKELWDTVKMHWGLADSLGIAIWDAGRKTHITNLAKYAYMGSKQTSAKNQRRRRLRKIQTTCFTSRALRVADHIHQEDNTEQLIELLGHGKDVIIGVNVKHLSHGIGTIHDVEEGNYLLVNFNGNIHRYRQEAWSRLELQNFDLVEAMREWHQKNTLPVFPRVDAEKLMFSEAAAPITGKIMVKDEIKCIVKNIEKVNRD